MGRGELLGPAPGPVAGGPVVIRLKMDREELEKFARSAVGVKVYDRRNGKDQEVGVVVNARVEGDGVVATIELSGRGKTLKARIL